MKWEKTYGGNELLESKDFYISYNNNPCAGFSSYASDNGSDETALCVNGEYYILNGDFRKQYEEVIEKGLSACMEVYNKHKKNFKSSWGK